jgi:pimeloyl-ACP methyl ester carboxylesterase
VAPDPSEPTSGESASSKPAVSEPLSGGAAPSIPIVLVHGAGAIGQVWQHQLLAFPRAVAPNLPGHPTGAALSTVPDLARWLLAFLDEYPESRGAGGPAADPAGVARGWVLGGYSMGGAVAIEAALAAPDRFRGLILIATGARLRVRLEFFDLLAADHEAAVEELLRWWFTPEAPPRVVDRARSALRAVSPAVIHDDFWASHHFDAMDRVRGIALPTLILCGEGDRMTPVKYSEYLHAQIAASQLVVLPGAGHMVVLEQPRAVNEAIAAFLRGLA